MSKDYPILTLNEMIKWAWATHRPLTLAMLMNAALIPIILLLLLLDPKIITGMPGWIKPLKFVISVAIYCATFLWLLTYLEDRHRYFQQVATVTAAALMIENGLIILQVIRNPTSHFNASTAFDSAVFSVMGIFIIVVSVCNLLLAIQLTRQKMVEPVFAWALRLGIIISSVGMCVAIFMVDGPTPTQLAALRAGGPVTTIGAHAVGVEDGGPGLPIVGWSITGGDLRVPHFFGLHGMQVIPLIGWLLTRSNIRRRLAEQRRLALIWASGLGYLGFVLILTWQALRGQSVVMPDWITMLAFLSLAALVAVTSFSNVALWKKMALH